MSSDAVLRTRGALALAFLLARYVALPFVDDLIRERIARQVIRRAVGGEKIDAAEVARLAAPTDGCLGCLGMIVWAPLRMLFFPIAVLLNLRFGSRDLVEVFALGRTVERVLADDRYPLTSPPETRLAYARDVRLAFDEARKGLDLDAVRGLLSIALGPIRQFGPAAVRSARRFWHGESDAPAEAPASRLAAALDDPRMKALLEEIDRRFDAKLLALRATSR